MFRNRFLEPDLKKELAQVDEPMCFEICSYFFESFGFGVNVLDFRPPAGIDSSGVFDCRAHAGPDAAYRGGRADFVFRAPRFWMCFRREDEPSVVGTSLRRSP